MINLDRLNMFLQVAETLNFSETALRLHLSQSTISKHINALEKKLNVELFVRHSDGVELTEAGTTLVPWAMKLIHDSIDLQNIMGALDREISGQLTIACSTTSGKYILPQLACRFRAIHPGVRIAILPCTQENIMIKLLNEDADLGISSVEMGTEGVECQPFFIDHISLIVPSSHPWSQRSSVDPEELLNEPILMRETTSGTRRVLLSELAKHDISLNDLNIFLEVGNSEAIVLTVSAGLGISFVSNMASAYARAWGCVENVLVNGLELQRRICIGRKIMRSPNRASEAFWNFIHVSENRDLLRLPSL